jgi:hypothetical protein
MLSRVDFEVVATITHNGVTAPCEVRNLSLSGIYFEKGPDLPMDAKVKVRLELSSENSEMGVDVNGTVARKEGAGFAVKLHDLELDSFIFLRNIMVYNSGNSDLIDKEYRDFLIWKSDKNEYIPT